MTTIDQERLSNLPPLSGGKHKAPEDGMCVMEAIAWLTHEPFSDHPRCVSGDLGEFLRSVNDRSPQWVRDALVERIPAILAARDEDAGRRALVAVDWVVRRALPLAFEAHDEDDVAGDWTVRVFLPATLDSAGLVNHGDTLRALSPIVNVESAVAAGVSGGGKADPAMMAANTASNMTDATGDDNLWQLAIDCLDAMLAAGGAA